MEKKNRITDFFSRCTLPIALASIIAYLVVSCYYYEQRALLTVVFAAAATALFLLFEMMRKHKFIGTVVYIAMLAGILYLSGRMMSAGWYSTHVMFTDWFYLNRDTAGFNIYYFMMVYVFGGFFLVSIIYYFTQIRFRTLGLMLCLLFPFVIYAKRADVMTGFEVALVITVFLAIVVHIRQQNLPEGVKAKYDISYLISVALFVSFAGAVAVFIPKPEVKSVLERDSHAFDITPLNNSQTTYSRTTAQSSARYGTSFTNEILFYAESNYYKDTYYLKRQSYDSFYDEIWHNTSVGEKFTSPDYYRTININRSEYYEQIKALAETGRYTEYGLDASKFDLPQMQPYNFRVYDDMFKGVYVPSPSGVIGKSFTESSMDPYYLYGDGEIWVRNVDADYDYTVQYYPETPEYTAYAKALGMTGEQYYAMLTAAVDNGDLADNRLLNQYNLAHDNYTADVEYTERMRDLAFEITEGLTSDYDKANALCSYFENNGFVYDAEYYPPDESIDYFLFEGKTGVCTSYATAMAIMARIVGLPARYVEGFAAYERDTTDSDIMIIRDSHAHAYVEVFIPGAGWLDFDPTIPDYVIDRAADSGFSFAGLAEYFSRALVFVAVLFFVFIVMMFDRILELVFRIRQRFVKGDERIIRLYARVVRLLEISGGDKLKSYTPHMLDEYALENNKADIRPISELFERTCFGGVPLEDERYREIWRFYKSVYRLLRKRPKPEKVTTSPLPQTAPQ